MTEPVHLTRSTTPFGEMTLASTARGTAIQRKLRAACMNGVLGALLLGLAACGTEPTAGSARLNAETLASWQAFVEPAADELGFQRIPWLATYVEGVHAADAARKPLLLWIMNGHPLGCT